MKIKMKQNKIISLITTLIVLVVVALTATTGTDDKVSPKEVVKLVRVVDGDTAYFITPSYGEVSVRFSGVNTPELKSKDYYAKEAKEYTTSMLEKAAVIEIEWDLTQKPSGNRIIGIVFTDGENLNLLLVEKGFANLVYLKDTMPYAKEYRKALEKAKESKLGIWK